MTDKPSWPQTAGGVTDWEAVFEDPNTGLIPLISQARSSSTLKQAAFIVVEQLYIRKNDSTEIEKFKDELSRMIPDDLPEVVLPRIIEKVSEVLRQVKNERKKKAAEFEAETKLAQLNEKNQPLRRERRIPPPSPKPSQLPLLIWVGALSFVIFAVYFFAVDPNLMRETQNKIILIQQMKDVAKGRDIKTHAFGGSLVAGTRVGKPFVSAEGIPQGACRSAAWAFVRKGIVAINGKIAKRANTAVIADLCSLDGEKATIIWFPKKSAQKK